MYESAPAASEHAIGVAEEFSDRPEFLHGVRQLFRSSEGVSLDELYDDTRLFVFGAARSFHKSADPLLRMEDEGLWPWIGQRRLAAALREIWQCGKVGFTLLPDATRTPLEIHEQMATDLLQDLTLGGDLDPESLLRNTEDERDLDFYRALPDWFDIYRGSWGASVEQCAAGVCWTTSREIAAWYARRFSSRERVLLRARIHKSDVATVFASEHEIAVRPDDFERLELEPAENGRFPENGQWDGGALA